jgi:hypothetical protein
MGIGINVRALSLLALDVLEQLFHHMHHILLDRHR